MSDSHPSNTGASSPTRNQGLDLLRGLAVVLVIFRHIRIVTPAENAIASSITTFLQRGGWIGVDLFFALSGFLVGGLIFDEIKRMGTFKPLRFIARRGFKIYPSFWALLIVSIIGGLFMPIPKLTTNGVLGELFFLQNYLGGLWQHTWSLAVEEHYYIFLTIVCWLFGSGLKARHGYVLPAILFSVLAICLALRLWNAPTTPIIEEQVLFPTHLRLDSLTAGSLLAYFWHFHGLKAIIETAKWRWVLVVCGTALLSIPFFYSVKEVHFVSRIGLTTNYLGSCLLVVGVATMSAKGLGGRFLAFVGRNSYNIYLWHIPAAGMAISIAHKLMPFTHAWWAEYFLFFSSAIVVGAGMTVALEGPVLAIRNRLLPSRSSSAV